MLTLPFIKLISLAEESVDPDNANALSLFIAKQVIPSLWNLVSSPKTNNKFITQIIKILIESNKHKKEYNAWYSKNWSSSFWIPYY